MLVDWFLIEKLRYFRCGELWGGWGGGSVAWGVGGGVGWMLGGFLGVWGDNQIT